MVSQLRPAADAITSQLGSALRVAEAAPPAIGDALALAAKTAFVEGLHASVLVGAGVALIGVIVAAIWLPARPRPEDLALQEAEAASGAEFEA